MTGRTMALVLNEEQRMLKDAAREFLAANAPVAQLRELRDARDPLGYRPETWQAMVELGWTGVLVPEAQGREETWVAERLALRRKACGKLRSVFMPLSPISIRP